MQNDEMEMSDVMVVLADDHGLNIEEAVARLKAAGLQIGDSDAENDVVEGTIPASLVKSLSILPFVKYVRNVFSYLADPTPEDHPECSEDVDDCN